jgi:hypothetical protein
MPNGTRDHTPRVRGSLGQDAQEHSYEPSGRKSETAFRNASARSGTSGIICRKYASPQAPPATRPHHCPAPGRPADDGVKVDLQLTHR